MGTIEINTDLTVGKVPDYQNKKYGKLQIASQKLAPYIGKIVKVTVVVEV